MRSKAIVILSVFSLTFCKPVETEDSAAKSRRGDLDGTRNVVNMGVYVNNGSYMANGELNPSEVRVQRQYSGDKYIDRKGDGFNGKKTVGNRNVNGLFLKMQALKLDHIEEIPVKVVVKNGYWVAQPSCGKKISIPSQEAKSSKTSSLDFCVVTEERYSGQAAKSINLLGQPEAEKTPDKGFKGSTASKGPTPKEGGKGGKGNIFMGRVSLTSESGKPTESIEIEVHWKRKVPNPKLKNPDVMITSMTINALKMRSGTEVEIGNHPFYVGAPIKLPEPKPVPANVALGVPVSVMLTGHDLGVFAYEGDGACKVNFDLKIGEEKRTITFGDPNPKRNRIRSSHNTRKTPYTMIDSGISNLRLNPGCRFDYGSGFFHTSDVVKDIVSFQRIDSVGVGMLLLDGRSKRATTREWTELINKFAKFDSWISEPILFYVGKGNDPKADRAFRMGISLGYDEVSRNVSVTLVALNGDGGTGSIMGTWSGVATLK